MTGITGVVIGALLLLGVMEFLAAIGIDPDPGCEEMER